MTDIIVEALHQPDQLSLFLGAFFLVSMLESLAVVGLIVPGVAILFALAAAAAQQVPFESALLAAGLGAFTGDALSFHLGRHFEGKVQSHPWLKNHQALLIKSETLFYRYGWAALLVARFIGPLRPFMPMTAGILNYSVAQFYCIALIGAILWAPVYLGPGFFLGDWPEITASYWVFIAATLLMPEVLLRLSASTAQSPLRTCVITGLLFIALAVAVIFDPPMSENCRLLCGINQQAQQLFTLEPATSLWLLAIQFVTNSASNLIVFSVGAVFLFIALKAKQYFYCTTLVVCYTVPFILKAAFDIDRPPGSIKEITQAFPSGHTYFATLLFLIHHHFLPSSASISRILAYWAVLVSISRLLLNVHWVTDIVGGILTALTMSGLFYLPHSQCRTKRS